MFLLTVSQLYPQLVNFLLHCFWLLSSLNTRIIVRLCDKLKLFSQYFTTLFEFIFLLFQQSCLIAVLSRRLFKLILFSFQNCVLLAQIFWNSLQTIQLIWQQLILGFYFVQHWFLVLISLFEHFITNPECFVFFEHGVIILSLHFCCFFILWRHLDCALT